MKYNEWEPSVSEFITSDHLWKMKVYRYALFLSDIAWKDVNKLSKNKLLYSLSDQLYRASGSVSANISEGYSRKSKLDQARFYEYALGLARETRGWYFKERHKLNKEIYESRLYLITEIIKMLLHIVPETRKNKVKESSITYKAHQFQDIENYNFK